MKVEKPAKIALIYLVAGVLWILFSDHFIGIIARTPEALTRLQTLKGWFFVFVTAALLYALVRRDFSRLLSSEKALAESEERFRSAFEKSSVGKALPLPDGRLNMVNQAFGDMLGYDPETLAGMALAEITHPDDRQASAKMMNRLFSEPGTVQRLEKRYIAKDGRAVWADVSSLLLQDADGRPTTFITDIWDITDRKRAENELRRQKELLQMILDNIPLMVGFFDAKGRYIYVNRAWEQTLGWTLAETRQRDVMAELYPDAGDRRQVADFIQRAERKWGEFRTHTKNGDDIDTVWINICLTDGTNIAIGEDVTRRRKEEARRRGLEMQLIQAQKMEAVGRLAGGVAHDFNNILSVIIGYTEMMLLDAAKDTPGRKELGEVHNAALRARDLTGQLLAFGRKQMLAIQLVDLNGVVREFERMLRRIIGEDIGLQLSLCDEPAPVKADVSQMEQVLMNLAVNARDAMPEGGLISIETDIAYLDEGRAAAKPGLAGGHYVTLTFSDSGAGMTRDILEMIFEPFFTTKSGKKGTGLGLSTVYGIVKQHRGNVWAYSEPGSGTTFMIYLPYESGQAKPRTPSMERPVQIPESTVVLVVEDDSAVREITSLLLKKSGCRVIEADCAAAAADMAGREGNRIDLLLTDVVMPDKKGPELYREIKDIHPETRVLYMSGYTGNMVGNHGVFEQEGCFIQKPFSAEALREKVAEVLKS